MKRTLRRGALVAALVLLSSWRSAMGQNVYPDRDPAEKPGERPYEMVWANRREPSPPSVRFDDLHGWTVRVQGGAEAALQVSRAQNVWNRPVARLRYRGDAKPGSSPSVRIFPPGPVPLADGADCAELWVYGNRWSWENPPDTPPLGVTLHLRDAAGSAFAVHVDSIRWREWWLMHRKLPAGIRFPAVLESLEFSGGRQSEWREIYLDSVRFYRESLTPLSVPPRPRRNLALFPGQSPGANTGRARLPFPTRPETILPMHMSGQYANSVTRLPDGRISFAYAGKDAAIRYLFDPSRGLDGIVAEVDGALVGTLLDGAEVRLSSPTEHTAAAVDGTSGAFGARLAARCTLRNSAATWTDGSGTILRLSIKQKSLILDVVNRTCRAEDLSLGRVSNLQAPRTVRMPFITYGGTHPAILLSLAGTRHVFTSIWSDWYRSNGSELYGADEILPASPIPGRSAEPRPATGALTGQTQAARINGGIRYHPRTDGKRNPMFERLFVTVSPMLEEVMPVVPNPVGLHAAKAADRLWQESWGPGDYAAEEKRCEMLRAYGIEKLIQCNHEITWRDDGESFTLRTHAAPKKGGDEALQRYVAHQRGLGWLSGLYTNYCDYIPVNEHWSPDAVQRESNGEWRSAWPRCWAEKPLRAVEFDALIAPQVKARYGTTSAYTDVQTAVSPWGYCDYDARLPGAGTFAQTFYAYGELLRNDSRVYGGPIFSEGTYHWLYAGLADGNYGHTYDGSHLAADPLLPVFDLYQIHSKECDIGVSWTSYFCDVIPNWSDAQQIDAAIDRLLLHTMAYGHIGWLVEETHGIARTCRSYYMLQQVQARYGLKTPVRIAYWDGGRLRDVSESVALDLPRTRRQLYIEYPGGLRLWLNDHPSESWSIRVGGQELILPPAGWAAFAPRSRRPATAAQGDGSEGAATGELLTFSALQKDPETSSARADYLRSDAYIYLDGRGQRFSAPEGASDGALAITAPARGCLSVLHISGKGEFVIGRPFGTRGAVVTCRAYDVQGHQTGAPTVHDAGGRTRIEPVKDALRYELTFAQASAKP